LLCAAVAAGEARAVELAKTAEALLKIESPFVGGLNRATAFEFLPDGRMIIVERDGAVRLRATDGKLTDAGRFAVSLASNEQGLLNVLPHPRFAENGLLFFYYSAPDNALPPSPIRPENRNRLVSVRLGDDGALEMHTQKILLQNLWGFSNHNGGALKPARRQALRRRRRRDVEPLRQLPDQRQRQDPALEPGRLDPARQPAGRTKGRALRDHDRGADRDLGVGPAKPLAHLGGPEERERLGGGRR